jgi:mannitol/fructose-specific phosphotransferase system IIA component (Ntr-type)
MKEKGLRSSDPFEEIISRSAVLDIVTEPLTFEEVASLAADELSLRLDLPAHQIKENFLAGTATGNTPVAGSVALPHFRSDQIHEVDVVLVRSKYPVSIPQDDPMTPEHEPAENVHAIFFLVSPDSDPGRHLRILAQIAGQVDEDDFEEHWHAAKTEQELREVLLRNERFLTLTIGSNTETGELAGKALKEIHLEEDCLVVMIHRDGDVVIPKGRTIVQKGDRLTIIGEAAALRKLSKTYGKSAR